MPTPSENLSRPGNYADDIARTLLEDTAEAAAATPSDPAVAVKDDTNLTPIERWRKGLKAVNLNENDANAILDSMLERGYWEREYRLFGGRITIRLRTRDAQHINRLLSVIDRMRVPAEAMVNEAIAMNNLAGSLSQFRTVTLPHPATNAAVDEIEDAFNKRYEFVARMPSPLMPAVRSALVHFDTIVAAALGNGAVEGF